MATYPTSIIAFTTKTNRVDLVDAAHVNSLQDEVVAIETELGSAVKGTATDLKTRLARSLANNGDLRNGTSFPVTEIGDGTPFYRTDTNTLYVYNGSSWESMSSLGQFFSAYKSADQNNLTTAAVKITFDTEDFDTGSNFASSTFTAPSAGYYLFTVSLEIDDSGSIPTKAVGWAIMIYKNGSAFSTLDGVHAYNAGGTAGVFWGVGGSIIMNLSTSDTVEVYIRGVDPGSTSAAVDIIGGSTKSRFTGCRLSL